MRFTESLKACAIVAGVLALGAPTAKAQNATVDQVFTRFDFERFTLSTDPNAVMFTDGARPLKLLDFGSVMMLNMEKSPLVLCVKDGTGACDPGGDLVSSRFTTDLGLLVGFGIADVRIVLPIVMAQFSDFSANRGSSRLATTGMADPQVGGRVGLWSNSELAVAGDLSFTIPLNEGSSFIGNTGTAMWPRVLGEYRHARFASSASLGYFWRYKARQIGDLAVNDEVTWSASAEYAIVPSKAVAGLTLTGAMGLFDTPSSKLTSRGSPGQDERPVEATIGGRYYVLPNLAVQAGIGRGLTGGFGAPAVRGLVGVTWNETLLHSAVARMLLGGDDAGPAAAPEVVSAEVIHVDRGALVEPEPPVTVALAAPEPVPPPPAVVEPSPAPAVAPPVVVSAPGKPVIRLSQEQVQIDGKIYFVSGTETIVERSLPVLQEVARVLALHSEIVKLRVEGHMSATGDPKFDIWLSQKRAEAVRDYLIRRGVAANRLEAKGMGTQKPLVPDVGAEGKSKNRRVEFVIVERASP